MGIMLNCEGKSKVGPEDSCVSGLFSCRLGQLFLGGR